MSKPQTFFLQSRLGKRVFILLVLCALAPLGMLAALSITEASGLLLEQGKKRISAQAKNHAMGVYERLMTARDAAPLLAKQRIGDADPPITTFSPFLSLAHIDEKGRSRTLLGKPPSEFASLAEEYFRTPRVRPTKIVSQASERQFLLQEFPLEGKRALLVSELNPVYLWGTADEWAYGNILCVVDSTNKQYVHCPQGKELNLAERLGRGIAGEYEDITWTKAGVMYRGRVWAQFMAHHFDANDWYFAVSVPEDNLLAAIYAFQRSLVLVVVLALLLIFWFSARQIRTMLIPLTELTEGTRRVSGRDFSARVNVQSQDEFGELGDAFNSMSAALGRQARISQALADIDRRILAREKLETVIDAALNLLMELMPAYQMHVIMLEQSNGEAEILTATDMATDTASRFSLAVGTSADGHAMSAGAVSVAASSYPEIRGEVLVRFPQEHASPELHASADENGRSRARWLQPLVWGHTPCGWLEVWAPDAADIGDEDAQLIAGLASRLALAISSAWRDDEHFQRAYYDGLTGLPNRRLFQDRLVYEMVSCKRDLRHCAVLYIDLDHFKSVNDTQGHSAGDQLLCEAARRMSALVRESDTVCRQGGDEFTVLLVDIAESRHVSRVANAIIEAMSTPFIVTGQESFLSASVGIAIYPGNGESAEELLKHADMAMYRAKTAGRGQAVFFEGQMNAEMMARLSIDRELRRAIQLGELELLYQPQVSLAEGRVEAGEALLRWNHPQRGQLAPAEFLAVAEDSGLIIPIGRWVIEEATRQIIEWRKAGLNLQRVSVNVSARQFRDADFVPHILRCVGTEHTALIELEITETAMLERMDLLEVKLQQLVEAGCTIALDDFGTGYSSMAYLKKLTVHTVKIDRAFIDGIDKSAESLAFVDAIIAMAHALGKTVVAEGAENAAQVQLLRERGCELVQGYHFSRPLRAADFFSFANTFSSREQPASTRADLAPADN